MLRVVPWLSREEWLQTYRNLYNFDNPKQQRDGLDRVEAWKSRSGSKLPLAVEATASLIAAGVEDVGLVTSSHVVRQMMAMVIVRFVNSMVDMEQKGAYARSVQSIADEIGLPDWLVDLRHEATHASLPSLEVLRAGCRFSLSWLRDCYWESQIAEFRERDESLLALIKEYAKHCKTIKSAKKKTKNSKSKKIAQEIADLVSKYNMWETLLDQAFGKEILILPALETVQEIFPTMFQNDEMSLELLKEVKQSFAPFLQTLQAANDKFLTNLVSYLATRLHVLEQGSKNDLLARFYSCFIHNILVNCSKKDNEEEQWDFKAEVDYLLLLEVFFKNPLKYHQQYLQLVVDNLEILSENLKDKLYKFSAIKPISNKGKCLVKPAQNEQTDFEVLDKQLPLVAKRMQAKLTEIEPGSSSWQRCTPSFAQRHKFGAFIGEEAVQSQNSKRMHEESLELEASFEDEATKELSEEDMEENSSENASESDLNEIEILCPNEASLNKLTPKMAQEIGENIWIF